jgi:type I restriction enzyme M protein
VPKTPSEASKRQKGHNFEYFPVDIAVFDDPKNAGDYRHLLFMIECKQPSEDTGLQQLEIYLGLEPHAKLGIWANSADLSAPALFVYKDKKGMQAPKRKLVNEVPSTGSRIDASAQVLSCAGRNRRAFQPKPESQFHRP